MSHKPVTSDDAQAISTDTVLKPSPAVAWQRMGDQVVVLDIPHRALIGLNPAASLLWETLGAQVSLQAGAQSVAERFEQSGSDVASDVVAFAQDLLRREVLVPSDTHGADGPRLHGQQGAPGPASSAPEADPYQRPAVEWEEQLEESGVYAACAKDPFLGPNPEQCSQAPQDFAS